MTSSERRALRRAKCILCNGAVDEHGHRGLWVPANGDEPIFHYVCSGCFEKSTVDQRTMDEAARTVVLTFAPAGGTA